MEVGMEAVYFGCNVGHFLVFFSHFFFSTELQKQDNLENFKRGRQTQPESNTVVTTTCSCIEKNVSVGST